MGMIPKTKNKQDPFPCLSAMQKCIRRGLEREAMEFALEVGATSKAFGRMVCNRLQIISHEDVGLATPEAIPFVRSCCDFAMEVWSAEKIGKWMQGVGSAIRYMSRAKKSREGDHFLLVCKLNYEKGYIPKIPDWAYDVHTMKGRRMGRGLKHFFEESCKLHNAESEEDPYKEEAIRLMMEKEKTGKKVKNELFDQS